MRVRLLNQRRRGCVGARRMRRGTSQAPLLKTAAMDTPRSESASIRAEMLMNLHLSRLVQRFPSLGTQLRLALYLDREAVLLAMAAVLSWHQFNGSSSSVRGRELRDLHLLLAHLGELLADRQVAGRNDCRVGQMHQTSF